METDSHQFGTFASIFSNDQEAETASEIWNCPSLSGTYGHPTYRKVSLALRYRLKGELDMLPDLGVIEQIKEGTGPGSLVTVAKRTESFAYVEIQESSLTK